MCCRSNIFTSKQFLEFNVIFFIHQVAVNKRILKHYQIIIEFGYYHNDRNDCRLMRCLQDIWCKYFKDHNGLDNNLLISSVCIRSLNQAFFYSLLSTPSMFKVDATLYSPLLDGYIFQNVTQEKYFLNPF